MYWPYAGDLEKFYQSSLGFLVRSTIRHKIKCMWADLGQSELLTLGIGFCQPLLVYRNSRIIAAPSPMGVLAWPSDGLGSICKVSENKLPFADNSFHRIIIFHTIEYTVNPLELLEEAWRVLAPEGKIIVIAPNRSKSWARSPLTPFGYGTPYSKNQLTGMIEQSGFILGNVSTALFMPPTNSRTILRFYRVLEKFICALKRCKFIQNYGGVLVAEGCKRVYSANTGSRSVAVVFQPVRA